MPIHPLPSRLLLPWLALVSAGTLLLPTLAGPRPGPATLQGSQEKGDPKEKKDDQDEDTKLAHLMERLRTHLKGAGKAIEAKDQDAAWKALCTAQQVLLEAKQESPAMTESKTATDRPAFVNAFRAKISEALK